MRKFIILLLVFVLLLVAPSAWRYFQFYKLSKPERTIPTAFNAESVQLVPTPSSTDFVDVPEVGDGLVLLDLSHDNAFTMEEIGALDGRLAQRGSELVPFTSGDLQTALRSVNAFVVITPLDSFTTDEIQAVTDFVERGGKLLMMGDPTRFNVSFEETDVSFELVYERDQIPLNSLANAFDIIFNGDYLYNTLENEGNFRNIILNSDGFGETAVTDGLEQVAFYGSHSLQIGQGATAVLRGDENTWSSATDRPGGLILAASSHDNNVLALGDIHFITEPYYTVFDNGRFISQISDFLTDNQQREYVLADFPYFFTQDINLIYTGSPELGPDAFDEIIQLQDAFRQAGQTLSVASEPTNNTDTLYLGLYNQAETVADFLASADINLIIDPPLEVEEMEDETEDETEEAEDEAVSEDESEEDDDAKADEEAEDADEPTESEEQSEIMRLVESEIGRVQMSGTALILFHEDGNDRSVIVLAASADGLESATARLLNLIPQDAEFVLGDCLLQTHMALCPTDVSNEEVEPELLTGGEVDEPEEEEDEEAEEDPAEEEEDEDDEGDEGDDEGDDEPADDIDAEPQGTIGLGETVEGELLDSEAHAWTFSDGPVTIDIVLDGDSDLDAILELYSADNELLESADNTFSGDSEELLNIEIEDDSDYIIVVRDFFTDGGSYTLTVSEASTSGEEEEEEEEEPDTNEEASVFIFIDDDGDALTSGFTSQEILEDAFSAFNPTVWVSSVDGPLSIEVMEGHSFLIWDSGDYEDPDGFFGEDVGIILEFLDSGADIIVTGSYPSFFSGSLTAELSEVEVFGTDPVLLDGLEDGQLITLAEPTEVVLSEVLIEDIEIDDGVSMLAWPADTEGEGTLVALAGVDSFSEQKTMFILMPVSLLPDEVLEPLLENIITWFGLN